MRALIVEDDLTNRLIMEGFLEPYFDVSVAGDGEQALEEVKRSQAGDEKYDLILLDIVLPGMDGHAVLREVRSLEQDQGIALGDGVKVIMTTASDDERDVNTAYAEWCEAYLVKPIGRSLLLDQLRQIQLL